MNATRRRQLATLAKDASEIQCTLDNIVDRLASIRDEEEAALDSVPESLCERQEKMQSAVDAMEEAESNLETIREELNEFISSLERASE